MKHKLQDTTCEIALTDFNITIGVYYCKKHFITTTKPTINELIITFWIVFLRKNLICNIYQLFETIIQQQKKLK